MDNKVVVKIVALSFGITWGIGGIFLIANRFGYLEFGTPLSMVLFIIGVIAPAIATFIVLPKNSVITVKELFKATFAIKQPVIMYLLVIGFVVIYFVTAILTGILEYIYPIYLSLLTVPIMIFAGGLEEVGWRYVLNPALERKLPFALACFITGIIWSLWHLPVFFIDNSPQAEINFFIFTIISIGLSFAYAAVYRISKSIWLCVLIHSLNNALYGSFLLRLETFETAVIPTTIISIVLIIASILAITVAGKNMKIVYNKSILLLILGYLRKH